MNRCPDLRSSFPMAALFALFVSAAGACGSNEVTVDRLFLRVTSEALPEGARIDGLRVLLSKGDVRFPASIDDAGFNFDLGDLDPAAEPVLIAFNYSGNTFGDGSDVGVTVLGRSSGNIAARFETRVDLVRSLVVDVALKALTPACDVDADGFPDCSVAGCCDGASDFADCEPTVATANPWGRAPACRSCGDAIDYDCSGNVAACVDSDLDGDADCEEEACGSANDPAKGPGQVEVCDGIDNDCDDLIDNGAAAASCQSGVCKDGACAEPTCDDTVKNGDETDVDCGGSCAGLCEVGEGCDDGADCGSGICGSNKTCLPPSCDDDVSNGDETDVDCGGPCEPCANGLACEVAGDCTSGVCFELGCRAVACGDGFVTGTETCDDGAIVGGEPSTPVGGDGCSESCGVESGWYCSVPAGATASTCMTECGDQIVAGNEDCDDGDEESLDGCSALCEQEAGWICTTPPGGGASVCVIDEIPPEPPVITSLLANGAPVVGGLTNVATLVVAGTAEAASSVRVRHAGNVLGTATTDGSGAWSGTVGPLADGLYTLTATATDLALNESAASAAVTVTVDTTPPLVEIDIPAVTNDVTPTITGTGENGAVVAMVFGGATFETTILAGVWVIDTGSATPVGGVFSVNANGVNAITATARDAAGNIGTATSRELIIDTTPPTLTLGTIAGDNIVNIAETAAGIAISGTAAGAGNGRIVTVGLNGQTYTASVNNGAWSASVPANRLQALTDGQNYVVTADVSDQAGNAATQVTASLSVDRTAPTVAISQVAGNDVINIGKANNGVAVSGTTVGAENAQVVTVVFGPTTRTASVSNNSWTTSFTEAEILAAGQGVVTITANVSDAAGNPANPGTRPVTLDTVRPGVQSIAFSRNPVNGMPGSSTTTVTFTFSEPVTSFSGADLTLRLTPSGGVAAVESFAWSDLAVVAGNPNAWTATLSGKTNFTGTARITVGVDFTDVSGNAPSATFESPALAVDTVKPTVSLVFNKTTVIRNDTSVVTFTFSEAPKAFNLTHLVVTNGTLSVPVVDPASSVRFTATFTPTDGLEAGAKGSVQVTTALMDAVDNTLAAAVTGEVNIDTLPPTLTIGTVAGDDFINAVEHGQQVTISGTAGGAEGRTVTVTWRGPGELGAPGTTQTAVVAGGVWSFSISGSVVSGFAEGAYVLTAKVSDAAGNEATAAVHTFTVDTTPPTVTIGVFAVDNIVNAAEAAVSQVLSGTTTGVANGRTVSVSIAGNSVATAVVADNAWSTNISSATFASLAEGDVTFSADVSDVAGNPATPATRTFRVDRVPATVVITWETLGGEPLSAVVAGTTTSAVAVFQFSEAVNGFEANDILRTWEPTPAGALELFQASSTVVGRYTVRVSPPSDYEGTVVLTVRADFTDIAGNPAAASTASPVLPIDIRRPTATVAFRLDGQVPPFLKVGDVPTVVVTFSETPAGFTASDLVAGSGTLGTLVVDAENPLVYTATYTPFSTFEGKGSVTLGQLWSDVAGNAPTASTVAEITIDTAPPVLTFNHLSRSMTYEGRTVSLVSISDLASPTVFTGTVTGLDADRSPVVRINDRDYVATRNENNWTATVDTSFTSEWPQGIIVATATAVDAVGNAATPEARDVRVLTVTPTVVGTFNTERINADTTTVLTLAFSTEPSGFDATSVSARYTPGGGGSQVVVPVAPADFQPDPQNARIIRVNMRPPADFAGTLQVTLAAGWQDAAGNPAAVALSPVLQVETQRPAVTFGSDRTVFDFANRVATVTVTTSEVMNPPGVGDFVMRDALGTQVAGAGVFTNILPDSVGIEGQAWVVTFTAADSFEGSVSFGTSTTWTDLFGNRAGVVTSPTVSIDTLPPQIAIATIGTNDRLGIAHGVAPIIVDATISGSVGVPEVTLLPGLSAPLQVIEYIPVRISSGGVQPEIWRITVPENDVEKMAVGTVYTLRVEADDSAGNTATANRDFSLDLTRPTAAIIWDAAPTIAIGTSRNVTFDFSEAVSGFDLSDVTVTYTAGASTVYAGNIFLRELVQDVADASIWRAVLQVPEDAAGAPDYLVLNGTLRVVLGMTWTDLAGNAPLAEASSTAAVVETVRPIATLSATPLIVNADNPTSVVEVVMSEAVTGFGIDDFSVTQGAGTFGNFVSGADANPLKFRCTFTRNAEFSGVATVTLRAVDGAGAPAWTDVVGNGPRDVQTARLVVNVPAPPAPTVVPKTLCTSSDPQTITGTFVPQIGGTFTVRVRNNPFTASYSQTYTLGETVSGGTLSAGTPNDAGVATWTLSLTGEARRASNGTNYQAIATVTNFAGLTATGEAEIPVSSNPNSCTAGIVGVVWDGRPVSSGAAVVALRQVERMGQPSMVATFEADGLNAERLGERLIGGDALLAIVAEESDVEKDSDGDGLSDELEAELGLESDRFDSNDDGIDDGDEDSDGDGFTNLEEIEAGSDPGDVDDVPFEADATQSDGAGDNDGCHGGGGVALWMLFFTMMRRRRGIRHQT